MNQLQKLAAKGLGIEIINSCRERGSIDAAMYNARKFYKYCKDGVKSGMFDNPAQCYIYISQYYNELKAVEFLANKYHQLYGESYSKLKLQIEKFFSIN